MSKILLSVALAACACCAFAEEETDDVPMYEGVWNVRFEGHRAARFELRDWAGTWRETGAGKDLPKACRGKKLPVTVQHSTLTALEFTVWGSQANPACPDTSYTFKPRDGKTLEIAGDSGPRATMTLLRK